MDVLERLNAAAAYVEAHLCEGMDMDALARVACVTPDSFMRFFSYMTGMTLHEYMRRRRLTLAACELRDGAPRVLDVAVKYGYDSADAFAKAFARQHGVTPARARRPGCPLKVYPPVSFHMTIKGAKEMDVKIIETAEIPLRGLWKQFTGAAAHRFEQEHVMWGLEEEDYSRKIAAEIPGTWYGVWDGGRYWIAKNADEARPGPAELCAVPAGTYAVFTTGRGGFAGDELPRLREQIFDAWFPDSGYEPARDYELEVYRLYPKTEKHKRQYEIWVPVRKADPVGSERFLY